MEPTLAWERDGSRLYRGDSLKWLTTLPAESVDCIWTDPPYFLSNGGSTCRSGRRASVDKGGWDRSQGIEQNHQFNLDWLAECHRVLKPTGSIWVTGTVHVYPSVGLAMQTLGFRVLNDIVWEKAAPPPNLGRRCFTHSSELILWGAKLNARYTFNYSDMKRENSGKQMKNVWRFTAPTKAEKLHGKHPTQKPIALIQRCLRASTRPGDVVLDPFTGSSSTGVAALAMGRTFLGCDLDEEDQYIPLSIKRLDGVLAILPSVC